MVKNPPDLTESDPQPCIIALLSACWIQRVASLYLDPDQNGVGEGKDDHGSMKFNIVAGVIDRKRQERKLINY